VFGKKQFKNAIFAPKTPFSPKKTQKIKKNKKNHPSPLDKPFLFFYICLRHTKYICPQ
jgi:hypothetical protein